MNTVRITVAFCKAFLGEQLFVPSTRCPLVFEQKMSVMKEGHCMESKILCNSYES